jgi:hypothetical protein
MDQKTEVVRTIMADLGRRGGSKTSPRKAEACRANLEKARAVRQVKQESENQQQLQER